MAVLPWDLTIDILIRLPVKDLLRFRSVAKPWKSLIDRPDFIKLHLSHSLDNTSNLSFILKSRQGLHIFDHDSLDLAVQPLGLPITAAEFVVVGSRNGLVVLAYSTRGLVLWNPSTRRYIKFPFSEVGGLPNNSNAHVVFPKASGGFGYDPRSDDHKIVIVTHEISDLRRFRVYSVNARTWKTVDGYLSHYSENLNSGVSVGGYLYWLGPIRGKMIPENMAIVKHIVGFDLSTDVFSKIAIPQMDSVVQVMEVNLSEFQGCLCMMEHRYLEGVDLWVMKESWTKLFSVVQPLELLQGRGYITNVMYLNGTERLLLEFHGKSFALCDVGKKTLGDFRVSGLPEYFRSHLYVQSLLRVDGMQPKAEDDGNKRTRQNREDFLSKDSKKIKAVGSLRGRIFYPRKAKKIKLLEA